MKLSVSTGKTAGIMAAAAFLIALNIACGSDKTAKAPQRPDMTAQSDYKVVASRKNVYVQKDADGRDGRVENVDKGVIYDEYVVTDADGSANIYYMEESSFKVNPSTSVQIVHGGLRILRGKMWVNFKKSGSVFKIVSPSATVGIRGTRFTVEVTENQDTIVDLEEGSVEFENEAGKILMKPGERAAAKKGATPVLENKKIEEDSFMKLK